MLTRKLVRVYVCSCQNGVDFDVNLVYSEIRKFAEFERVNTD